MDRREFGVSICRPVPHGLAYGTIAAGNLLFLAWLMGAPMELGYDILAAVVFVLAIFTLGRYDLLQTWETGRFQSTGTGLMIAWIGLVAGVLFIGFFTKQMHNFSRVVLLAWMVTTPVMFLLLHILLRGVLLRLFPGISEPRSAVIAFSNQASRRLVSTLRSLEYPRYRVLGYFEDRARRCVAAMPDNLPQLGGTADVVDWVKSHGVDVVFVVLPEAATERLQGVLDALGDTTASLCYVPDFHIFGSAHVTMSEIGDLPVLTVADTPCLGIDGALKRCFDIAVSATALLLTAPLLLLIAAAIRLTMGGPVIYSQRRYGLNGKEIMVHKFRTMRVAEDGAPVTSATRGDPRVTPLGRFLRRTSVDELPQFWNVLKGNMSVVGPRPHSVVHNEEYRKLVKLYMSRHKTLPGITGWAQVNGLRGEVKCVDDMKRRVECDLDYIRHWSLELDLRIILRTLWVVISRNREVY